MQRYMAGPWQAAVWCHLLMEELEDTTADAHVAHEPELADDERCLLQREQAGLHERALPVLLIHILLPFCNQFVQPLLHYATSSHSRPLYPFVIKTGTSNSSSRLGHVINVHETA